MDSYKNIINFAIISIAIIFFIHILFKNKENMHSLQNKINIKQPSISPEIINNDNNSQNSLSLLSSSSSVDSSIKGFNIDSLNGPADIEPELANAYPISNDIADSKYLDKLIIKNNETCGKVPKTIKQFNKDFFNFRDRAWHSSSMRYDPVDKINDMKLSGNISQSRRYPNMKIKDLYDELTKGPNLYKKQCVRTPLFDNMNPDEYHLKPGSPGTIMNADNWKYDNEKIMNGGEISQGLTGNFEQDN
jgi:hypothetical protein